MREIWGQGRDSPSNRMIDSIRKENMTPDAFSCRTCGQVIYYRTNQPDCYQRQVCEGCYARHSEEVGEQEAYIHLIRLYPKERVEQILRGEA